MGDTVNVALGIGGGGGGAAVTVTVAVAVLLPAEFVASTVYVVVVAGDTTCVPLAVTEAPFKVTAVAFVDVHCSVDD